MTEFGKSLGLRETAIEGLLVLDLAVHPDQRGWFKENWQREKMVAAGLPDFGPVQNNISYNATAGITRGLHAEPWDKFVSVAAGSVFGAWCDLRAGSSTYGRVVTAVVSPDVAVYVPRGVANGFQALEDDTAYSYLVNDHWSPDAEYAFVNLADPALGIAWPLPLTDLSAKDQQHPPLAEVTPIPDRKVLVTGADGQLGRALREVFPDAEFVTRDELDITSAALASARPWRQYRAIINAAAYTAVDQAEGEGRAAAWAVNAGGAANLARVAASNGVTLVQVSSDYVFDGGGEGGADADGAGSKDAGSAGDSGDAGDAGDADAGGTGDADAGGTGDADAGGTGDADAGGKGDGKGGADAGGAGGTGSKDAGGAPRAYTEADALSPLGVYGQTKAAGDLAAALAPRHYIVRTSWVIGDGANFVRTMASLALRGISPSVVRDQIGRLTFTEDLARGIRHLLDSGADYGTYNLTNSGRPASWAEVARAVYADVGADPAAVSGVTTAEYFADKPQAAPRPANSVLDLAKLTATGFTAPDWRERLRGYLAAHHTKGTGGL